MKKFLNLMIGMFLIFSSCYHKHVTSKKNDKRISNQCLPDSASALVKGKKLLSENFGNIILRDYIFKAVLTDDSIWHIIAKPNVPENEQVNNTISVNRGSEMVLINKHTCDIIGFSIAR